MSKVEVFNTGGGIWLAETDLGDNKYAVVNSEYPEQFAIYLYAKAEDDKYYPEDMLLDQHRDELSEDLRKVYDKLLLALVKR